MKAFIVNEDHSEKFWLVYISLASHIHRVDEFRRTFADLGNVQSLLPTNFNAMALTATATKATLACVMFRLGMQNPVIIGLSPDIPNIKHTVEPCPDILH